MQYPWPHDSRVAPRLPPRRAPRKYVPPSRTIQREDVTTVQLGSNSAATLVMRGHRLEWEVMVDRDDATKSLASQSIEVYPRTSMEEPSPPEITGYQRAEQSARFLRDFYPDLDIPFEVLQDLVVEDHLSTDKAGLFDPSGGNRLVALTIQSTPEAEALRPLPFSFLAFACGKEGSCLNVSAFGEYNGQLAPFIPCPNALKDFEKPILQIIGISTSNFACAIAVRTSGEVVVCKLMPRPHPKQDQAPVSLEVLGLIEFSSCETRSFVEMILDHVSGETVTDVRLILVDESGRLWRWCSADGSNTPVHLIDLSIEDTRKYSLSKDMRHWRLAHSGLVGVLYVISGRSIGRVDLREESPSCEIIFQLHPNDGILTSITPTAIDFILCAATTTKLLWIDTSSGKTVAAWRHDRQSEPGLNVAWMPGSTHLEVCLYSSRNNWVSVYSMRWSEDQQSETGVRVRVHATSNVPRSFLLSSSQNASRQRPRKGFQLFRHPLQDPREDRSFDVFELTSGHAVFRTRVSDAPSPSDPKEALRVWSEEVHAMQAGIEEAERSGSKYGPLGLRESQTYDLRSLYQRLFIGDSSRDGHSIDGMDATTSDPKSLIPNLHDLSLFSDTDNLPILTFHDIVRRAGGGGSDEGQRSNLFASTVLHSEEGYEALHDACETDAVPPTEAIAQNTAWSWNIGETLDSICGGTVPIPSKLQDLAQGRYREFDVLEDDMHDKDAALLDREYTSARMLAVDLAMSLDVFSTRSVQATESQSASKRVGIVDAPYMMMSKTSIDADELPPINFSFLTPRSNPLRATIQEKSSKKKKRRRRLPDPDEDPEQGARLLLSGWKIGDDPQGVCYVNPYDNNAESSKQSAHSSVKAVVPVMETARKMVVPGIQISSLPHTTGRSSDAPSLRNAEPTSAVHESHSVFASQPEPRHGREWATQPPDAFGDSPTPQTMWSSTQPISGLFGTRPASSGAAKKKKRVGGF